MDVYHKLDQIKEKIKLLASNLDVLRSENDSLVQENEQLKSNLKQNAAEIRFLKTQLTNYKEKIDEQVFGRTLEHEEEIG